jgi:hypothetical protein
MAWLPLVFCDHGDENILEGRRDGPDSLTKQAGFGNYFSNPFGIFFRILGNQMNPVPE